MELKMAALAVAACILLLATDQVSSDDERWIMEGGSAVPNAPPPPAPHKIVDYKDCLSACDARCTLHSRKNRCTRACLSCCGRCRCVPSGPYGNQETCGTCYTGWTTHGNKTKCP